MPWLRHLALRLSDERGFGLVEVLVTTVLLALVAVGVLAGIDGPAAISSDNKSRSVAAALAEQEQEHMRGMKFSDLVGYNSTRTVTEGHVPYTVTGVATWTSDKSGTQSCTSNSTSVDYLKVTATATWPGMRSGQPASSTSMVSPPVGLLGGNYGSLVVQVADQGNNPVTAMPVTISPGSTSASTNSFGCALFAYQPAGNYTASYSRTGWVDPSGNSNITLSGSVTALATTTLAGQYALADSIAVSFNTLPSGASSPIASTSQAASVANPGIPAPGYRTFTAATPQATINATNLFPFTSGYGVYSGSCAANNPVTYNSNYWSSNPGYVTPSPSNADSVTVREPAINATVKRSGSNYANAHVIVKATAAGCSDQYTVTTNALGLLTTQGYPFGTYSVCADDGTRSATNAAVSATSPTGSSAFTLTIPTNGSKTTCS